MGAMIRIAISVEAFEAIARTLPLGNVGYKPQLDPKGEVAICVEAPRRRPPAGHATEGREPLRNDPAAGRDRGGADSATGRIKLPP